MTRSKKGHYEEATFPRPVCKKILALRAPKLPEKCQKEKGVSFDPPLKGYLVTGLRNQKAHGTPEFLSPRVSSHTPKGIPKETGRGISKKPPRFKLPRKKKGVVTSIMTIFSPPELDQDLGRKEENPKKEWGLCLERPPPKAGTPKAVGWGPVEKGQKKGGQTTQKKSGLPDGGQAKLCISKGKQYEGKERRRKNEKRKRLNQR